MLLLHGTNAKNYLINLGAPKDKVFISFNTVDTKFFEYQCSICRNKEKFKNELGINSEIIILYVGQLIERKGLRYLLEAHKN
jgi:glycosyltransferase involved in cell wall biosynthesis